MNLRELFDQMNVHTDETHMPVLAVGGAAGGQIFAAPKKANTITLDKPVGFKVLAAPGDTPAVLYVETEKYNLHKFFPAVGTTESLFAIAMIDGIAIEEAITMLFSAYCECLSLEAGPKH